jgi:hypothetical protein
MRVLVVGSTGMVGKGALLECLDDARVDSVVAVNRQSLGIQHPKLKEIIHSDFYDLASIENELTGIDALFYCIGVTSAGMTEAKYSRLTYDMTLVFANAVLRRNKDVTVCFVSGKSTDSTEKGKIMWARIKGKAENALLALPFKGAYMFRPGIIRPLRGVTSRTGSYRFFYLLFAPLMPLFVLFPSFATTTARIGRAMINAAAGLSDKKILESTDINRLAEKTP